MLFAVLISLMIRWIISSCYVGNGKLNEIDMDKVYTRGRKSIKKYLPQPHVFMMDVIHKKNAFAIYHSRFFHALTLFVSLGPYHLLGLFHCFVNSIYFWTVFVFFYCVSRVWLIIFFQTFYTRTSCVKRNGKA